MLHQRQSARPLDALLVDRIAQVLIRKEVPVHRKVISVEPLLLQLLDRVGTLESIQGNLLDPESQAVPDVVDDLPDVAEYYLASRRWANAHQEVEDDVRLK